MTHAEFEKMIMFWSLKGKISNGIDMGTKGLGIERHQMKRITVKSKDFEAIITYIIYTYDLVQIDYCDIYSKKTNSWDFYPKETGLSILIEM